MDEYLKRLSTKVQLISLILSLAPGIGEAAGAAGEGYGAYLEAWGETFERLGYSMEKEWNSTRKYPNVYLVMEWYLHIPLLGNFPETYHYEECAFDTRAKVKGTEYTFYQCPSGTHAAKGKWW